MCVDLEEKKQTARILKGFCCFTENV